MRTLSLFTRTIDSGFALVERARPFDTFVLRLLLVLFFASSVYALLALNEHFSSSVPVRGGVVVEGMVGTPRFINPVLASTRVDRDLSNLLFRSLMTISADGTLEPDIAESVTLEPGNTTYTITLKRDIRFHDGTPLSARDVAFTIALVQDPDLKSPLRGNWIDVQVETVDEYTLTVTIPEPYAPFIENFQLGILPAHRWSELPIEEVPFSRLNTEPIGSGPFAITDVAADRAGRIGAYTLKAAPQSGLTPRLSGLEVQFFRNDQELSAALAEGDIDATAYLLPSNAEMATLESDWTVRDIPLPRLFAVFFNENRSVILRDQAVRQALSLAINRSALVEETIAGHGVPTTHPIFFATSTLESLYGITETSTSSPLEEAATILADADWQKNEEGIWQKTIDGTTEELRITIRTSNDERYTALASELQRSWQALGVSVGIEQFEQNDLVQSVIRPRDFTALLYGLEMSRTEDLYPFWHSSQQDDPGLNIAQYANITVDELLETARNEASTTARTRTLRAASDIITTETPAIFLFQPTFVYLHSPALTAPIATDVRHPADRFADISTWYRSSADLWPWFSDAPIE